MVTQCSILYLCSGTGMWYYICQNNLEVLHIMVINCLNILLGMFMTCLCIKFHLPFYAFH